MINLIKKFHNSTFLLFCFSFIIFFALLAFISVKIIYAKGVTSVTPDCYNNYSEECIEKFRADCLREHASEIEEYTGGPGGQLIIPHCDQTPREGFSIQYSSEYVQDFDEYCYPKRSCQLNDFIQLFINLAKWGWWILPSLALLFMTIGGFLFINAGGNPNQIEQGKKILTSVILGVVIVLILAWILTSLIIFFFTGDRSGAIFGNPWWGSGDGGTPGTGCCITKLGCIQGLSFSSTSPGR